MADQAHFFWKTKQPGDLTAEEWESLCDGCALCCLFKLEDVDTGEILHTNVVCRLLDLTTCRCTDYPHRHDLNPECVLLTPELILQLKWLPETCAYRLLAHHQDLPDWHPLLTGDPLGALHSGTSVRGWVISEMEADMDNLEDYVVDTPEDTAE